MATPPSYFLIPFLTSPKTHGYPGCVFPGIPWVLISFRPWNGCAFALGFPPGGHQQLGVPLTFQNPSLPGIIIPPGAQSNRHAKASSSSTAWPEETQVETPTVRITPLHRIIQEDSQNYGKFFENAENRVWGRFQIPNLDIKNWIKLPHLSSNL